MPILKWFLVLKRFYQAAIVGVISGATSAWLATHGSAFFATLFSLTALYAAVDAWRHRNQID